MVRTAVAGETSAERREKKKKQLQVQATLAVTQWYVVGTAGGVWSELARAAVVMDKPVNQ